MRMMIVTPVKRVPPLKPSGKAGRCADMYSNRDYHLPGSATATQSARLEFAEGVYPVGIRVVSWLNFMFLFCFCICLELRTQLKQRFVVGGRFSHGDIEGFLKKYCAVVNSQNKEWLGHHSFC